MTPRKGLTLFRSFLNFLSPFQTMVKPAGMKILSSGLNLATLAVDLWWNSIFWTQIWFFQKIMSIRTCTCSSNLTDFLVIRREFVFFTRDERIGLRYPGWEIGHVMLYSIFEKWGGTIWKLPFGGCFTKNSVLGTRKMKNDILVRWKGKLPTATLFFIPRCTCVHNMGTLSQTMPRF